jgi:hypothetical protein
MTQFNEAGHFELSTRGTGPPSPVVVPGSAGAAAAGRAAVVNSNTHPTPTAAIRRTHAAADR